MLGGILALLLLIGMVGGAVRPAPAAADEGDDANLHLGKTVSAATLRPNLTLQLAVDRTDALPGNTLTYQACQRSR